MASSTSSGAASPSGGSGQGTEQPTIDWVAAEQSPEFRELIAKRRSFVVPATTFFFVWYFGFILLAGYAPGFMGASIYQGFTVGYLIALTQFVMVWALAAAYLKRAEATFDPLAARAAETALEAGRRGRGRSDGAAGAPGAGTAEGAGR